MITFRPRRSRSSSSTSATSPAGAPAARTEPRGPSHGPRPQGRPSPNREGAVPRSGGQHRSPPPPPRAPEPPPVRLGPPSPETLAAIEASPFTALGLVAPLVRAILDEGYTEPTPVQIEVIPHALAGRDVLAAAQTGTGKTAAFVLPLLQRLAETKASGRIRVLVLTPTRELAAQIAERISVYGRYRGLRHAVVYGGVSQHGQERVLATQPDVLVATPGRLLDLMAQGVVRLDAVTHFVLDEADRMLDMGFVHDVRRVTAALPTERQTLFFSATIPREIEQLARGMLRPDPARVSVTPQVTTAEGVEQHVVFVAKNDKRAMLETVLKDEAVRRVIVFTRTKHGANRLSEQLEKSGIESAAIHGNKSQGARERALEAFRAGTMRVLVATDLAARGIDVDGISHVINFDLPNVPESYVHRIGRTGRAGATGRAISFCDHEERDLLADIERLIRKRLPTFGGEPRPAEAPRSGPRPEQARSPHAPPRRPRAFGRAR